MKNHYDVAEIREALMPKMDEVIKDLLPAGKREGNEWRCGDIDGAEKGRSMSASLNGPRSGCWHDHSTDESGDVFTLVQLQQSCSFTEAVAFLAQKHTGCAAREYKTYGIKKKDLKAVDPEHLTVPLSVEAVEYAQYERGISEATLRAYDVRSSDRGEIAFLSWVGDKCVKIHYATFPDKNFRSTPEPESTLWGKDYATPDLCQGKLVITEGQWDALSYAEVGMAAVSVPSGVSNLKWMDTDWEYLQGFHTIYISADMDDKGQDMATKIITRLGVNKCHLVELSDKDANELLKKGDKQAILDGIANAKPKDPEEIVPPSELAQKAWDEMHEDRSMVGEDLFLPDLPFRIRKHEYTLVTGYEGSGKTAWTINQLSYMMSKGIQGTLASLEMPGHILLQDIAVQVASTTKFRDQQHFIDTTELFEELLQVYNTTEKVNHRKLMEVFEYLHKRYGCWFFIIDNLATLSADRGDFSAQTELADDIRGFCKNFPVHVMLVAHPRKPQEAGKHPDPPVGSDVRGASEIVDYADNLIVIWRNKHKPELIQQMQEQGHVTREMLLATDKSAEDGRFVIRKQRFTGKLGSWRMWFNPRLKIFSTTPVRHQGFATYYLKED
jgi:twinkle protein